MADSIRVKAPGGGYPILIAPGLLADMNAGYAPGLDRRCIVVTNTTLEPLYGRAVGQRLPDAALTTIPDGEQYKTLDTVARLYADFVAARLDRGGTVVALGGGVVGDTAGFAAATYMRGVRLVQIPTSLLAMVDSSVGGKVGVDLPQGKNLVGAFKQPEAVLIDPDVLETLPDREWRCGLAEVIKHGLLADAGLLDLAGAVGASPQGVDRSRMAELIRRAVQVKVSVVEQDPYESGVRAHLNLGHTFAHAIEQVSGYRWPHGEAVAVGLVAAARLSFALGLCDQTLPVRIEAILTALGLPHRLGALEPEALIRAMSTDKKWQAGQTRFILLRGLECPEIVEGVPLETVATVLESLR